MWMFPVSLHRSRSKKRKTIRNLFIRPNGNPSQSWMIVGQFIFADGDRLFRQAKMQSVHRRLKENIILDGFPKLAIWTFAQTHGAHTVYKLNTTNKHWHTINSCSFVESTTKLFKTPIVRMIKLLFVAGVHSIRYHMIDQHTKWKYRRKKNTIDGSEKSGKHWH